MWILGKINIVFNVIFSEETINDDTIQTLELCMEQTDSINLETSLEEKGI